VQLLSLLTLILPIALTDSPGEAPPSGWHFCSIYPPIQFTVDRTRTLVHDASLIVHARAIGYADAPAGDSRPDRTYVAFEVLDVLHGELPSETLTFLGRLVDHDGFAENEPPYLTQQRGGGDCIVSTYRAGGEYLLLLGESRLSPLDPYWAFLAPTNEQVRGADDPWIRWVRDALAIRHAP
jgi:hypothetical protein